MILKIRKFISMKYTKIRKFILKNPLKIRKFGCHYMVDNSRYYVGDRMIWNLFYLRSFGHGNFWLKSLKVLRCNVYNTSLYNKKMGSSLTTHPINPHIYENLYAI